jgi:hypothetical protein
MASSWASPQPTVVEGLNAHDAIEQIAAVGFEMVEQHLTHVAGAGAMAQQQDRVGVSHGGGDAGQVVGVDRCPLARPIPIVAVGEALAGAPQAMGAQHRVLHLSSLQPVDVALVVVEVQHQSVALVTAGRRGIGLRVVGAHPRLLQKAPHPHHRFGIQIGLAHPTGANPGFGPIGETDVQATVIALAHLGAQGAKEGLHLGHAHPVLQGVREKGLQSSQMVFPHRSWASASTLSRVAQSARSGVTNQDLRPGPAMTRRLDGVTA